MIELLVVVGLAAYRATRLLTNDSLAYDLRSAIIDYGYVDDGRGKLIARSTFRSYVATLLTCQQCLGVWVVAAFYLVWDHWHAARWVFVILAIAGAQSLFGWLAALAANEATEPEVG